MKCSEKDCGAIEATMTALTVESRHVTGRRYFCDVHGRDYLLHIKNARCGDDSGSRPRPKEVEFDIDMVLLNSLGGEYPGGIWLREVNGDRHEFVLVSAWSYCQLIDRLEEDCRSYMPVHISWEKTISALDGRIESVLLTAGTSAEKWFRGELRIRSSLRLRPKPVPVRASDGIILAIVSESPIYVHDDALAE